MGIFWRLLDKVSQKKLKSLRCCVCFSETSQAAATDPCKGTSSCTKTPIQGYTNVHPSS